VLCCRLAFVRGFSVFMFPYLKSNVGKLVNVSALAVS
jgi:hypothetical protein